MQQSNKKLLWFMAIFTIVAVIIFIVMQAGKKSSQGEIDPNAENQIALFHEEIGTLKGLLENHPDSVELINQIGHKYYDINQFSVAIDYYEISLELRPDDPLILTDCAVMYFQSNNSDKALEYLDKAIKIKPDLSQAYYNKGIVLMTAKNDHNGAIKVWEEYIKLNPESETARIFQQQIDAVKSGG